MIGPRLAVDRFERAGGEWTNELAAAFMPIIQNLSDPFYLVLAVWVILLTMLALKNRK